MSGRLTGVQLRTDDGRLRVDVAPNSVMTADWHIETDGGSVTLILPRRFSAALDARPDDERVRMAEAFDGRGRAETELLRTLCAGGHTLRVRTGHGSIRVEES